MEHILHLSLDKADFYYQIFFLLAFLLSYAIIILYLIKRKKFNSQYLTAIALISLSFIIGIKLIPLIDFYFFPPAGTNEVVLGQMTVGGVILGLFTLMILVRYLNLDKGLIEVYTFALIISMTLQKFGCLFGGCCYGIGDGIIKVSYDNGVAHNALQIYQIMAYVSILFILYRLKKGLNKGSVAYLALFFYTITQFGLEFYKTEQQTLALGETVLGIKILQWIYLFLIILAMSLFIKNQAHSKSLQKSSSPSIVRVSVVFMLTILILLLTRDFLYKSEIYVVNLALIPALIYIAIKFYQQVTIPKYRLATIFVLVVPLLLMSQTVTENKERTTYTYHSVGLGYKTGNAHNRIVFDSEPGSCGGTINDREFDHTYSLVGGNYSWTKVETVGENTYKYTFGLNGVYGIHNEAYSDDPSMNTDFKIIDFAPYTSLDSRWIGFSAGIHVGKLSQLLSDTRRFGTTTPVTGSSQPFILPNFSVRLFPKEYVFLEYSYASKFLSPFPEMPQDIGIGSSFGLKNDFYLKVGGSFASDEGTYISSYIPIKNKFVIEPLIMFGEQNRTFMLSAHYRFGNSLLNKRK
ncbi:MAG: hypothetical protein ABFS32_13630 [Bacteroidota bacterium]